MNLNHLAVFRAVAAARSFTEAAKLLAADKAHVSRVVRALEESLGVALITRTTRKVGLTPAGEGLLAMVSGPLEVLERAGTTIADRTKAPSGLVTLTTTPDLARALVAPVLPSFRARFPQVTVRVHAGPDVKSFADPSLDLALRVGQQRERDVKVRKLGELEAGFFAAPRYLAARGTPRAMTDLAAHETLWPFGDKKASFGAGKTPPPSIACDDFAVVLEVARAGGGVAVLPTHLAKLPVLEGALVRLFPDVVLRGAPLALVSRSQRPLPARVEALKAHLLASVPSLLA